MFKLIVGVRYSDIVMYCLLWLKKQHMSYNQETLVKMLDTTEQDLAEMEAGNKDMPLEVINRYCALMSVDIVVLFSGAERIREYLSKNGYHITIGQHDVLLTVGMLTKHIPDGGGFL